MAITKGDHRVESITGTLNVSGQLTSLIVAVNYALVEDGIELTRVRDSWDVLSQLSAARRDAATDLIVTIGDLAKQR